MFLPKHVIVLSDGEIKKQNAIPARTLRRVRRYEAEVLRRGWGGYQREVLAACNQET